MSVNGHPTRMIALSEIVILDESYPREKIDLTRVEEIADLYAEGGPNALPPLTLLEDPDGRLLLVNGRHRVEAARRAGSRMV